MEVILHGHSAISKNTRKSTLMQYHYACDRPHSEFALQFPCLFSFLTPGRVCDTDIWEAGEAFWRVAFDVGSDWIRAFGGNSAEAMPCPPRRVTWAVCGDADFDPSPVSCHPVGTRLLSSITRCSRLILAFPAPAPKPAISPHIS